MGDEITGSLLSNSKEYITNMLVEKTCILYHLTIKNFFNDMYSVVRDDKYEFLLYSIIVTFYHSISC